MTLTIQDFDDKKVNLLKNTICKGADENEFGLFLHACKRTGLDPFVRQIYAVKRWDSNLKKEVMAIQVGIDGYRLIAERTGKYAPGRETVYEYNDDGSLYSATSYVKKQTTDGTWHEVSATAFFTEYCAYTKDKAPTLMWATKPHIMLSKCAEACALRKAFPAELSGLYTQEEMEQADNPKGEVIVVDEPPYDPIRDDPAIQTLMESVNLKDFTMVKDYLLKYCDHYKKKVPEAISYYTENKEKFTSNYQAWIAKYM